MLDHVAEVIETSPRCQATGHVRQKVQSTLCTSHPGRAQQRPAAMVLLATVNQASITGHPLLPYGCILGGSEVNLIIPLPSALKRK